MFNEAVLKETLAFAERRFGDDSQEVEACHSMLGAWRLQQRGFQGPRRSSEALQTYTRVRRALEVTQRQGDEHANECHTEEEHQLPSEAKTSPSRKPARSLKQPTSLRAGAAARSMARASVLPRPRACAPRPTARDGDAKGWNHVGGTTRRQEHPVLSPCNRQRMASGETPGGAAQRMSERASAPCAARSKQESFKQAWLVWKQREEETELRERARAEAAHKQDARRRRQAAVRQHAALGAARAKASACSKQHTPHRPAHSGQSSRQRLLNAHESAWQRFEARCEGPISMEDIPWPERYLDSMGAYVSSLSSLSWDWNDLYRRIIKRWHPDSWSRQYLGRLVESEREDIMKRVTDTCQALNAAKPKLR